MKRGLGCGWPVVVVFLIGTTSAARCAAETPASVEAQIGYDGLYKLGYPTPCTAPNFAARLLVPDVTGDLCTSAGDAAYGRSLIFGCQASAIGVAGEQAAPARAGEAIRWLPIPAPLPVGIRLGLADATALELLRACNPRDWQFGSFDQRTGLTPAQSLAVDAIVLADNNLQTKGNIDPSDVERWVSSGGRLIWIVHDATRPLGRLATALQCLLPAAESRPVMLPRADALEAFAASKERIPASGRGRNPQMPAIQFDHPAGRILTAEGDVPLVIERPYGLGSVVFVAVALHQPPLAAWRGRAKFLERLLDEDAHSRVDDAEPSTTGPAQSFGYGDLAGQLYAALDQFDAVRVVPFWAVTAGWILLGTVVSAGDWWLVNRVLLRPVVAWITVSLWSVVVWWGVEAIAARCKPATVEANQVDVVDVDVGEPLARVTSWTSIYSPSAVEYDLAAKTYHHGWIDDVFSPLGVVSFAPSGAGWQGLHRVENTSVRPTTTQLVYQPDGKISAAPFLAGGTREFYVRGTKQFGQSPTVSTLRRTAAGDLAGRVVNRLPVPLDEAVLLFDRWAWSMGHVEPDQPIEPSLESRRDLQALLKQAHVVQSEKNRSFIQVARRYDPTSLDVVEILTAMMFHQALGGRGYTSLPIEQFADLDLSRQLRLGRAILVGRAREPAVQWRVSPANLPDSQSGKSGVVPNASRRWTYWRVVLPVESQATP